MHSPHDMASQAYENRHGLGYAAIIFAEHSLGKTKYRSLAGLAIAVCRGILRPVLTKFKGAPAVDASVKTEEKKQ